MAEHRVPTSYRGTVSLDSPLRHSTRHLRLLALDAWDDVWVLRGVEAPATAMPFPGSYWAVETDQGTHHVSVGGGAGGGDTLWHWEVVFDTPLPGDVAQVVVYPRQDDGDPAPGTTLATVLPSVACPATTPHVADDRRDPACYFCNLAGHQPPPSPACPRCPTCRAAQHGLDRAVHEPAPARPRVLALSAELGTIAGNDIALCSLDAWPTFFDLTLSAQGPALAHHQGPSLGGRWDIEDDQGHHHTGITTSGFSGVAYIARARCTPALDPRAGALTIAFPDPFGDGGIVQTTITLPS